MLICRLLSSLIFFIIFFAPLCFEPPFLVIHQLMMVFAAVVGTIEFYHLAASRGLRPITALGLIFALIVLLMAYLERMELFPVLIFLAFMLICLLQLMREGQDNFAAAVGANLFGCLYASVPFALLLIILNQQEQLAVPAIVFLVLVSWCSDIGAYTIGRLCGRHPMAPTLSPNKTIEGAIGGIAFSVAVALLLVCCWPGMASVIPLSHAIVLALLFAVVGQLGDLAESALKRDAELKDSGLDLTGHGGILDIIDSLIFCAPIMFIYLMLNFPDLDWL